MITPVSALSGFLPDIVSTFSPAPEFSFEDSSWKKYATPVLQVARLFSPGLDVALGVGEAYGAAQVGAGDLSSDHSESHWGRNLLVMAGLGVCVYSGWKYWKRTFGKGGMISLPPQPQTQEIKQVFVSYFGGRVVVDGNHHGIGALVRDTPDPLILDLLSKVERFKYLWIKVTDTENRLVIFGEQITHVDMLAVAVKHDNPVSSLRAAGYMAVTRAEIGNIATKTKIAIDGRSASFSTGQNGFWINDESRLVTQDAGLSGIDTFILSIFGNQIKVDVIPDAGANVLLRNAGY